MNRRKALGVVSIGVLGTPRIMNVRTAKSDSPVRRHAPPSVGGLRVSTLQGDIGELEYAKARDANKKIQVFLDDVDVGRFCETADEGRGYIVRFRQAEDGSLLVSANDEILRETVHGHVRVVIS